MDKVYEDSLSLHKEHHGKLEIKSKVPLENRGDLSLAYTPGVGQVCLEISEDPSVAREYTIKRNMVAIVSDGSAILGLGNLGALAAIPVMEGKAILFKEFAGVDAFPICLDTQDTEEIIKAVKLIAPVFGGINLEDISAPRCFEIENRLRAELDIPVFHDDQHGTAVVVLAGLINALKVKGMEPSAARVVVNGAGAAGISITKLLLMYGFKDIALCDTKGAIVKGRADLNPSKEEIAEITNRALISGDLGTVLKGADVFIGVSKGNIVSSEMIQTMAANPIVFAMANPVPEIMPDLAHSAGALVVATGRSDFPNQVNNVLAFPGIFRGALDNHVRQITDEMMIKAAEALAGIIQNPTAEKILPDPLDKSVATVVAAAIKE
jgi:malate dehydrogenase (oxaloacetate-decarboxylating)